MALLVTQALMEVALSYEQGNQAQMCYRFTAGLV